MAYEIFDLLLLLGFTLRLMRLFGVDHLGRWYLQDPVLNWAWDRGQLVEVISDDEHDEYQQNGWRGKIWAGVSCTAFCLGFWITVAVIVSLYACGGPGEAATIWRYIAGAFALNYLAGHIHAKVD